MLTLPAHKIVKKKDAALHMVHDFKRLSKSAFFNTVREKFSFLQDHDFRFKICNRQVPTEFRVSVVSKQIAIQFSYDVPDHMLDCYVFPVIDGNIAEEFVGPTGFYWELVSYCQSILGIDREISKRIASSTASIADSFERTVEIYLRFLRELDLNDLSNTTFRKRSPRK